MKLDAINDVTTEVYTDQDVELEEQSFTIDEKALGVFFKGFSDSLYSNKIGSIVREIVSNAVDAHAEAGVNKMVIVNLSAPDAFAGSEGEFTVEDFGVGISPDRVSKTYSRYFASTKRNTNDEIGGFGIGAKSPLAYTESFTVTTRVNHVEYQYLISRGEKAPTITLLGKTNTDKGNGTKVSIAVKSERDALKFEKEIKAQLRYFENVYFPFNNDLNDYKLFKGKHFIYNPVNNPTHLEICLGKVAYPLDSSILYDVYEELAEYIHPADFYNSNIYNAHRVNRIPIALYFNIGEISVTMSREAIEYTDATVEAIIRRAREAFKELGELASKVKKETDDLILYYQNKNKSELYIADNVSIPMPWSSFNSLKYTGIKSLYGEEYKPTQTDPFSQFFKIVGTLNYGKLRKESQYLLKAIEQNKVLYRLRSKLTKRKTLYIEEFEKNPVYIIKQVGTLESFYEDPSDILTGLHINPLDYSEDQQKAIVKNYYYSMLKIILKHSKSYDDTEIPDFWLKEYKEALKQNRTIFNNIQLNIKTLYFNNEEVYYEMGTLEPEALNKRTKKSPLWIYGTQAQADELEFVAKVFSFNYSLYEYRHYYKSKFSDNKLKIMKVSKETAKVLKQVPNCVDVESLKQNRVFKRQMAKLYWFKKVYDIDYEDAPKNTLRLLYYMFPKLALKLDAIEKLGDYSLLNSLSYGHNVANQIITYSDSLPDEFPVLYFKKEEIPIKSAYEFLMQIIEKNPWLKYFEFKGSRNSEAAKNAMNSLKNLITNNFKILKLYE